MSLGPCSTALLASLAKGFGVFANLNSSLSSVSHRQDKESCILLSELSSALLWDPGAPSRQDHSAGSQGLLEQGDKSQRETKKGRSGFDFGMHTHCQGCSYRCRRRWRGSSSCRTFRQ